MYIVVFDTETTSVEKPFVYDIGYVVYDTENECVVLSRSYIVKQTWENRMLFSTAYYADKKEFYRQKMKAKAITKKPIAEIVAQMITDFEYYEIAFAYAFNSSFDEKVFEMNCEWHKVPNPFDNIEILDIRGLVHSKIAFTKAYQDFCERLELFTESGNYSTTAESVFKYVSGNTEFIEEHTALADAEIELDILLKCIELGCEWNTEYKVYRTIQRVVDKQLEVKDTEGEKHYFPYNRITVYKEKNNRTRICLKRLDNNQILRAVSHRP